MPCRRKPSACLAVLAVGPPEEVASVRALFLQDAAPRGALCNLSFLEDSPSATGLRCRGLVEKAKVLAVELSRDFAEWSVQS